MPDLDIPIKVAGLRVTATPTGDLASVTVADTHEVLLSDLRVAFDPPWVQTSHSVLVDEIEQIWTHPHGVRAIVRQFFEPMWSLRVTLVNQSGERVEVPGPWWQANTGWPPREWLAGAEGSLAIEHGSSPRQLVFTQLRGHSSRVGDRRWLAGPQVVLTAKGAGAQYLVSWRADWWDDPRKVAAMLPAWWPDSVTFTPGDACGLRLPDAAITSTDLLISQEDDITWLTGEPGAHAAQVHHRHGTTDLRLWWSPDPLDDLAERAGLVLRTDPRRAADVDAWLVRRALDQGLVFDEDWVGTAIEALVARPGTPTAFTVLAAADQVNQEPDLMEPVVDLVTRLPVGPGSALARLAARVAAASQGVKTSLSAPDLKADDGTVEAALLSAEAEALTPEAQPSELMWRVLGLLGAGLPGDTGTPAQRARVVALSALLPEDWDLTTRWPVGLAEAREQCRRRLLAEYHPNDVVAWLWWEPAG